MKSSLVSMCWRPQLAGAVRDVVRSIFSNSSWRDQLHSYPGCHKVSARVCRSSYLHLYLLFRWRLSNQQIKGCFLLIHLLACNNGYGVQASPCPFVLCMSSPMLASHMPCIALKLGCHISCMFVVNNIKERPQFLHTLKHKRPISIGTYKWLPSIYSTCYFHVGLLLIPKAVSLGCEVVIF